jgi:predicted methyltransferase
MRSANMAWWIDRRLGAAAMLVAAAVTLAGAQTPTPRGNREFDPANLGSLAPPDRDEWQQPDRIMDALGIYDGNRVADVGAGGGWFTTRLARRVGPNGVVYAEDVREEMFRAIGRAASREGQKNVVPLLGTEPDPNLPKDLHAVLMVGTYWYLKYPQSVLRSIAGSLAPNGRLGIVEYKKDGAGGPGPNLEERVDPEVVIRDAAAAGLKLRSRETFLRYQYLLIFGK